MRLLMSLCQDYGSISADSTHLKLQARQLFRVDEGQRTETLCLTFTPDSIMIAGDDHGLSWADTACGDSL